MFVVPPPDTKAATTQVDALAAQVANKADATAVAALSSQMTSKANATDLAAKADKSSLTALANTIPQPATAAPPAVQVDSAKGADSRYALADHTHESRLQARRIQVTPDANGRYVYTFPKAYPTNEVPIVEVTAETPAGVTYRNDASILQGSTTNTQTTIIVTRVPQTQTVSILGAALNLFTPVTTAVWVNIMSRAPS